MTTATTATTLRALATAATTTSTSTTIITTRAAATTIATTATTTAATAATKTATTTTFQLTNAAFKKPKVSAKTFRLQIRIFGPIRRKVPVVQFSVFVLLQLTGGQYYKRKKSTRVDGIAQQ